MPVVEVPGFGPLLRQLRRDSGFTLRQLAERSGSHFTHLSRLEQGSDRAPSRGLVERLARALGPEAGSRLAAAAGILTEPTERAVARTHRALAEPVFAERSLPALRRIDAGVLAESLLRKAPSRGMERDRVNPTVLCRTLGIRPEVRAGEAGPAAVFDGDTVRICDPGDPDDAAAVPRVRFLLSHAAGHALIGNRECTFPRMADEEAFALDLAAHLLCPRALIERTLRAVSSELDDEARNPWAARSGDVVTLVAERLAVPGWVALRRLADEALLDDDALYYSLGDR
ncbi:MAG: Helix-turn-helix domain [Frankiaceae bacterium]|jgi:transcriptional regulator with XRE-family HTH domain|nr:Helix-turn-helix domain [Frankiaceae bacterium]